MTHTTEQSVFVSGRAPGQREQALEGILRLVVSGRLALEQRTSESWIADQLRLSRTPVREALAMLARDLLVTQRPQVGVWVRRVSATDIEEILHICLEIERLAVPRMLNAATSRSVAPQLSALCAEMRRAAETNTDGLLRAEHELHALICEHGGFLTGARAVRLCGEKSRLFHVERRLSEIDQRLADNEAVVEAVLAGDRLRAEGAVHSYYEHRLHVLRQHGDGDPWIWRDDTADGSAETNLRDEIRRTFSDFLREPSRGFVIPTGRSWAEALGYPSELAAVPDRATDSFAGVANPFAFGSLRPGEHVLDLGCGAGTDMLIAAQMVGPTGRVTGVDMTQAMLERAAEASEQMAATNVDLVAGEAEALPFPDASFDVLIGNSVVGLVTDKDVVLEELARVLRPTGRIQFAEVTTERPVDDETKQDPELWAGSLAGALPRNAYVALLEQHGFGDVQLEGAIDTYRHSASSVARRKALESGACGIAVTACRR